MSLDQIPWIAGFAWALTQLLKPKASTDPRLIAFSIAIVLAALVFIVPGAWPFVQWVGGAGLAVLAASAAHMLASPTSPATPVTNVNVTAAPVVTPDVGS